MVPYEIQNVRAVVYFSKHKNKYKGQRSSKNNKNKTTQQVKKMVVNKYMPTLIWSQFLSNNFYSNILEENWKMSIFVLISGWNGFPI